MASDAIGEPVVNWPHHEVNSLQAAKGPFDLTERLVATHHLGRAHLLCRKGRFAAHDGMDLVEAVAPYFPEIAVPALTACFNDYKALGIWNCRPILLREGFEWLRDAGLSHGRIRRNFSYEECVDMRFAEQVVREDPPSL